MNANECKCMPMNALLNAKHKEVYRMPHHYLILNMLNKVILSKANVRVIVSVFLMTIVLFCKCCQPKQSLLLLFTGIIMICILKLCIQVVDFFSLSETSNVLEIADTVSADVCDGDAMELVIEEYTGTCHVSQAADVCDGDTMELVIKEITCQVSQASFVTENTGDNIYYKRSPSERSTSVLLSLKMGSCYILLQKCN